MSKCCIFYCVACQSCQNIPVVHVVQKDLLSRASAKLFHVWMCVRCVYMRLCVSKHNCFFTTRRAMPRHSGCHYQRLIATHQPSTGWTSFVGLLKQSTQNLWLKRAETVLTALEARSSKPRCWQSYFPSGTLLACFCSWWPQVFHGLWQQSSNLCPCLHTATGLGYLSGPLQGPNRLPNQHQVSMSVFLTPRATSARPASPWLFQ